MQSKDQIGVTFVNAVLGRGSLNGIVNISFGVFNFDPVQIGINDDGTPIMQIDNSLSVAARLRMDLTCAKQLHEALGSLIESIESTKLPATAIANDVATGKPN